MKRPLVLLGAVAVWLFAWGMLVAIADAQTLPNAVPAPWPQQQFLNSAGAPAVGGYLCTYAAGTSTPLATYTDSTAGTPNTNPIVLDSAGRASVWIGPSLYKFVLRTGGNSNNCSTGSVEWSQDNVSDTTLYFANYVKTVGTSSLISYLWPGTGGVTRTQYSKNQDVVSIKDFGAVGDGSTDDTTAITAALAWTILGTTPSTASKCVYFPDAIYRVTAGFSITHTVCLVGNAYRWKYTGAGTISAMLTLVGDVMNVYGTHNGFLEGSLIQGMVLDGGGHATNGLTLQGVVSSNIDRMRVTNVTNAGLLCSWCQQTNITQLMVSADFETYTTTPTYGLVIDNISSDNYVTNVNIDHVSSHGIWLKYALNSTILGGTSEGNGGYGVMLDSGASPFRQSFNNAVEQLDTEVNASGDFCFCDTANNGGVFNNTIFQLNSFSIPGITFSGSAHNNNIYGGEMGGGSTASAGTYSNGFWGVGCIAVADPCWTDSGQNLNTVIRNQSTGTVTPAANNYNTDNVYRFSATSNFSSRIYTPSATFSEFRTGATAGPWISIAAQSGLAAWLTFPKTSPGFQFISEATYRGTARPEGSIVNGNWGFGSFNTNPPVKFHFQDAVTLTVDQAGSGQGTTDLHQFMGFNTAQDTLGTVLSKVDYLGKFWGPVAVTKSGGGADTYASLVAITPCNGGNRGTMAVITDANTNTWGGAVASGGGSNTVMIWCNGTAWTVMGK